MYAVFHTGIFYDGRESSYCRPTFYEVIHQVPGFKGHLAHVGWPWHDECIAVLNIGSNFMHMDPDEWGFKVDLSFGPPADWQLQVWQRSIDTLPTEMLLYASDVFWPCEPERNTVRSTFNLSWGSSRRPPRLGTSWKKAALPAQSIAT